MTIDEIQAAVERFGAPSGRSGYFRSARPIAFCPFWSGPGRRAPRMRPVLRAPSPIGGCGSHLAPAFPGAPNPVWLGREREAQAVLGSPASVGQPNCHRRRPVGLVLTPKTRFVGAL
jgi:hypothetical protein